MMNNEEIVALPDHLVDHDYFLPVVYEDDHILHEEEEELEDEEDEEIVVVGVSETYSIIPGVQSRSRIYVDNLGFKYYKREARGGRVYLVCERQKKRNQYCHSTATVSTDLRDNRIHLQNYHDHQPAEIDLNVPFLREAIGERGIDPAVTTSFMRTLYNNEIINHPEAAPNYTFLQAQERVKKMRRRRFPLQPLDIGQLAVALNEERNAIYASTVQNPPSRFFQQALVVNGRSVGLIFANMAAIEKYREDLATVTLVGIDGTFKTVPRVPADLKCFLTVQVVFRSVSFPMVYALLGSMTEEVYSALFDIVRNILPLNYELVCFITDYEKALMSAVQQSFPESQLRCCWFHFTQSIVRYCHRRMNSVLDLVRTNPVAARVLRMVLALPHLPATRNDPRCPQFSMTDGFRAIIHYTRQFPEIERGMRNFLIGYVESFWLLQVGPDLISVFGEEYRTNNYLESFHATLLVQMQRHPNVWNFLQKLTIIENQYFIEFEQARRNLRIRDGASRRERENTTNILAGHVEQLNQDGDLIGFLRRAGHRNDGYVQGIIGPYPQV
ncbi:uncharacterized protein LOC132934900 isoform X1 [Metopolophium dirhodum]|uniref:uncharacterized protein LOC132934900 isoform X1 n=1 Tax=Metopolophium dirhodum TaxID=44670 RepID=UPI0029906D3C|nr:uncharacterized protein LOC132934900 isoform X1 [Metopolophium dirhodum]